ncbi:MAG TPA: DNA polymerase III subunit delta' [Geobacteraceae bacterium]|nr:DNA polymerase III subunit delta' [Geobacteraceae bacterium]
MPFSDIKGQAAPVALLRRSLAAGKIAHAYIFEGIEGCGKKKTALALVKAIFCGEAQVCGKCPACRKVDALQHPDLHMVEPDGAFIKIDQIRELQRELSYRPFEAGKKVCVMEAAERLNPAAANAFLKTLEEPPGNALLILLTTNADAVLPTILSRCQRLSFSPLPSELVEECLGEAGVPAEAAKVAASLAGGSMKKALEISAEDILLKRGNLLEKIADLSQKEISPLFSLAEELGSDRDAAMEALDLLTVFLRDVLLMQSGGMEPANSDLLPLLNEEVARSTPEQTMGKIELVSRSRQALLRNVNPRLTMEVLFMGLSGC